MNCPILNCLRANNPGRCLDRTPNLVPRARFSFGQHQERVPLDKGNEGSGDKIGVTPYREMSLRSPNKMPLMAFSRDA